MNKAITIVLATALIATASVAYKSISVNQDAYIKVTTYSRDWKLSLRDTASRMILEYPNKNISHMTLSNDGAPFLVDFGRETVGGVLNNNRVHIRLKIGCVMAYSGTSTELYGTTTLGYENYDIGCK